MYQESVIPDMNPGSRLFNKSSYPYTKLDSRFTVRPAGRPGMTRQGFASSRHSEILRAAPWRAAVSGPGKKGFTLIELLVVVLIIAILASVALPQYQVAVEKARLARVMSNVKTIKNAAELYYMANGNYEDDLEKMDISRIDGCLPKSGGQLHCADGWYDWKYTNTNAGWAAIGHTMPYGKYRTGFLIYGDYNSHTPGAYECWAKSSDPVAVRVCKSFGGVELRSDRCRPVEANIGSCTVFSFP